MTAPDDAGEPTSAVQGRYHRGIFHALAEWGPTRDRIVDLSGKATVEGLLGLDQMGHFGPNGCELVAQAILSTEWSTGGAIQPLRLCELGCGYGGAVRDVAHRLRRAGTAVWALGVDVVAEHCRAGRAIGAEVGITGVQLAAADVDALPVRGGAVDVVVVTGSMPHFAAVADALREAHRALVPGGLLVITEEVSIVAAGRRVSDEFLATHPPGVFFLSTLEERLEQVERSGLRHVEVRPVGRWALDLWRDRLRAIDIFRGAADRIFGTAETDTIVATLQAARAEVEAGTVVPLLLTARRPFTAPRRAPRPDHAG